MDGAGEEDTTGAPVEKQACILRAVKVSDAVISAMSATTALQGRQTGEWEGFKASWTYHPDNGLDIIMQEGD